MTCICLFIYEKNDELFCITIKCNRSYNLEKFIFRYIFSDDAQSVLSVKLDCSVHNTKSFLFVLDLGLICKSNTMSPFSEFGVHLVELTLDRNGPLPIRQLASVLLKQYVEAHWCTDSEKVRKLWFVVICQSLFVLIDRLVIDIDFSR